MTLPFPFAHSEACFGEQKICQWGEQGDWDGSCWVLLALPFSSSTIILFLSPLD